MPTTTKALPTATPTTAKAIPTTTLNTTEVLVTPSYATSMATEDNTPPVSQHLTTPTTEQMTTHNPTTLADTDTPPEGTEPVIRVLLGCVIGSTALLVVVVSMLLCLVKEKRRRTWRNRAEETLVIQSAPDLTKGTQVDIGFQKVHKYSNPNLALP